jgi:hypothetical protein
MRTAANVCRDTDIFKTKIVSDTFYNNYNTIYFHLLDINSIQYKFIYIFFPFSQL